MSDKYFNIPIDFLKIQDIRKACRLAIYYALKLELDNCFGDIDQVLDNLGISAINNSQLLKELQNIDVPANSPKVGIKKSMLNQFRNEEKTSFEEKVFRAFCSLKSIIGSKPFYKSNNEYLEARMWGFATIKEYQESKIESLSRYSLDKIKIELQLHWGLEYYSNRTRGFYFSFSVSLETIINYAEQKRVTYQKKELQKKQESVYLKVMNQIKNPP
jgi:hypothetical protein